MGRPRLFSTLLVLGALLGGPGSGCTDANPEYNPSITPRFDGGSAVSDLTGVKPFDLTGVKPSDLAGVKPADLAVDPGSCGGAGQRCCNGNACNAGSDRNACASW